MSRMADFYSRNETRKPPEFRVYHNNGSCPAAYYIPPSERRPGTGGYTLCEVCMHHNKQDPRDCVDPEPRDPVPLNPRIAVRYIEPRVARAALWPYADPDDYNRERGDKGPGRTGALSRVTGKFTEHFCW